MNLGNAIRSCPFGRPHPSSHPHQEAVKKPGGTGIPACACPLSATNSAWAWTFAHPRLRPARFFHSFKPRPVRPALLPVPSGANKRMLYSPCARTPRTKQIYAPPTDARSSLGAILHIYNRNCAVSLPRIFAVDPSLYRSFGDLLFAPPVRRTLDDLPVRTI
jgi:hypothetical protein